MAENNASAISPELRNKTDLIIVCCHAVYTGDGIDTGASQWIMQDFQRADPRTDKRSEHETFIAHIHLAALTAAAAPQRSLLIFSGGRTTASPRTEAQSYALILSILRVTNPSLFPNNVDYDTEDLATDSYQNLLFSILRFRRLTGSYPRRITVITHAFKEQRFLAQHGPAIKYPSAALRVQGLNPPFTAEELTATQAGERDRAAVQFQADPYGVRAPLSSKRTARNWRPETANVELAEGLEMSVRDLLEWTGGESGREVFPSRLPWE